MIPGLLGYVPDILALVPGPGLLFGLLLGAAILGGYVAHAFRVPRVVGYLFSGAAVKLGLLFALGTSENAETSARLADAFVPLKAIKDLGLGIILFSIGRVFEVRHLRAIGSRLSKISIGEAGASLVFVFVGVFLAGLVIRGETAVATVAAFAALLAIGSMATAPAATLFVLREYDAKGSVSDTILSLTGLNNIACIILFYLAFTLFAMTGLLDGVVESQRSVWLDLAVATIGSAAFGVVIGFSVSVIHAKLHQNDTLLILVATLIVLGAGEGWLRDNHGLSYNFLLTAIFFGATFANIAIDPDRLEEPLQLVSRPILIGFFVMAGYQLHLSDLKDFQLVGVAYVVCRIAGKAVGARWGIRRSGSVDELGSTLGLALLCQAAVIIGLADFVEKQWDNEWARRFVTVALGSVVIFEVCGPLLIKWIVKEAGEVKAVTLLRRSGGGSESGGSILALTWQALRRTVGLGPVVTQTSDGPLCAKDVMRTNIQTIRSNADFTSVLHSVEASRFNHFPVIDEAQQLVGVIHFRDLRDVIFDPLLSKLITAVDVADESSNTVPADMTIEDVMSEFRGGDVGSLPVVEGEGSRKVVGIIEQRDVLRALHDQRSSGVASGK